MRALFRFDVRIKAASGFWCVGVFVDVAVAGAHEKAFRAAGVTYPPRQDVASDGLTLSGGWCVVRFLGGRCARLRPFFPCESGGIGGEVHGVFLRYVLAKETRKYFLFLFLFVVVVA